LVVFGVFFERDVRAASGPSARDAEAETAEERSFARSGGSASLALSLSRCLRVKSFALEHVRSLARVCSCEGRRAWMEKGALVGGEWRKERVGLLLLLLSSSLLMLLMLFVCLSG
jgi:hypothetical protein